MTISSIHPAQSIVRAAPSKKSLKSGLARPTPAASEINLSLDSQDFGRLSSTLGNVGPLVDPEGVKPIVPRKRIPLFTANLGGARVISAQLPSAPAPELEHALERETSGPSVPPIFSAPEVVLELGVSAPAIEGADTQHHEIVSDPKSLGEAQHHSSPHKATNTLTGLALAYQSELEAHLLAPMKFIVLNFSSLFVAVFHLSASCFITYLIVSLNDSTQQIFLQGGILPNAGKLIWAYLVSLFSWSIIWIFAHRLIKIAKDDVVQCERLGRGFFSPNTKEWDRSKHPPSQNE